MRLHSWHGPGYRVSPAEDTFFTSPLAEPTVFRFRTDYFEVDPHVGGFSIKLVLAGEETYFFHRRRVVLRPGQLLLVNEGEEYSSLIEQSCESMSFFFRKEDVKQAIQSVTLENEQLLDGFEPDGVSQFVQAATRYSPKFELQLRRTMTAMQVSQAPSLHECADEILVAALIDNLRIAPPQSLATVRRRATRDELISRVLRAREVIDDSRGKTECLDDLAAMACLSRFHFLRLFAQVIGETPGNYARRRRLLHAEKQMKSGIAIDEIAQSAGYSNVRNFLRAYKRLRRHRQYHP